jgi:site-specific recombinase XerD
MLTVYRRHLRTCKAGHKEEARTAEFDERKKGFKRCNCPIFASGTMDGVSKRQNTGQWEWETARAIAKKWEAAGRWDGPKPQPPQPSQPPAGDRHDRTTIVDATEAFLATCQNRGISLPTLKKYRTFVKQLREYSDSRGYLMADQLTITDMDRFYASWKDGKRARAKKLERLKAFVRFCMRRKWIKEDIAEDLKAPEGSSLPADKMPFTDEELQRIYAVCDTIGAPVKGPGQRPWTGEDVKDFIYLSIYTGLRISDVSIFNISKRLIGNDVFLRMHKTKKELYTWIPDWLVNRLRDREKNYGALIFRSGDATNMRAMSERWREHLKTVFKLAGPWEQRPTPHRLRHAFVRILLEHGVPDTDVAELIGDTVEVLRRHYAKWLPGRQKRLSNILRDALGDKPRPRLIAMPGSR